MSFILYKANVLKAVVLGVKLRVEPKEYSMRRSERLVQYRSTTPRRQLPSYNHNFGYGTVPNAMNVSMMLPMGGFQYQPPPMGYQAPMPYGPAPSFGGPHYTPPNFHMGRQQQYHGPQYNQGYGYGMSPIEEEQHW